MANTYAIPLGKNQCTKAFQGNMYGKMAQTMKANIKTWHENVHCYQFSWNKNVKENGNVCKVLSFLKIILQAGSSIKISKTVGGQWLKLDLSNND